MTRSTRVHPIEIGIKDLDTEPIPPKGLCAVLPACNNEFVIGSVVLHVRQFVDRVIVVDDGSSDFTADIAKFAGAEVIRLEQSTGKAYAVLLGLRRARETGCRVVVTLDAAGEHNSIEIKRVAGKVMSGKADLVIGSPYLERHVPPSFSEKFSSMILSDGTLITDANSSFMAFSRNALDYLDFRTEGFRLNRDIVSYFDKKKLRISEVPITLRRPQADNPAWGYPVKVLAAMPAYNEEKFLAKTILNAQKYVDRVLVVDDGSTDATGEIAHKLGAIVVHHEKNGGYGAALKSIFEKAKELHVEVLIILDSDGQHDPKDIQILVDRLEKGDVDVVIGSRFAQGKQQYIPMYRILGMKILDRFTRFAGADRNTDSQSGFRAYNKKAINAIRISGEGMSVGSEILVEIAHNNLKIAEMPIDVRYDIEDTSTQNPLSHGILVIYNLIGLISYRRPLPAFGIPGFLLVLIGFITGSAAFSEYYSTTRFPFMLTMVSAVFLIMGLLLMIGALILNFLVLFVQEQRAAESSHR
jgi:glycosyltransferase involved in cell wall biosynthesis